MKKFPFKLHDLVGLLALAAVGNSQISALLSTYVINGDAFQITYWMRQFRDPALFQDDLLTDYAKHFQSPWGFVLLYRVLSPFLDPLVVGKILPFILFVLSCRYLFKLVCLFTGNYAALLAALLFMIVQTFLISMVGGHPRAFAYPLLIMFLYYLIKKNDAMSCLILVIQTGFYPMIFMISALAYLFVFIHRRLVTPRATGTDYRYLLAALLISAAILGLQYRANYNPTIGTIVTRSQMLDKPEFYAGGKHVVLPTPPTARALIAMTTWPFLELISGYPRTIRRLVPLLLNIRTVPLILLLISLFVLLFLAREIIRGSLIIPIEFVYLFASSVIMFKISDLLLFKLYIPIRYLQPIPLIYIMILGVVIAQLIAKIGNERLRRILKFSVVIFIALHFNMNKGIGLYDYSEYYYRDLSASKKLYEYLSTLPKDALIAAHPYLADGIPTFSRRKVFLNYELSYHWFDNYWLEIDRRTRELFAAYYSTDASSMCEFCRKNRIDYLVVDMRHFTKPYLEQEKPYFEPFNAYIRNLIRDGQPFALLNVPERDKLFTDGDIFVIHSGVLSCARSN